MKLLLFTAFVATISYVNAGKTARLIAAINAMNAMNAMNGGALNGGNPGMLLGGLNPPIVAGGGAGIVGQPQFAQFVPRVPAFVVPAPMANYYPVPGVNAVPYMGLPQMAPVNNPPQPLMGNMGAAAAPAAPQQQLPVQPNPALRFRRQIMKAVNTLKSTVDTQVPAPSASASTAPCDKDNHPDI